MSTKEYTTEIFLDFLIIDGERLSIANVFLFGHNHLIKVLQPSKVVENKHYFKFRTKMKLVKFILRKWVLECCFSSIKG